ncbi:MAG: phage holin family protein [Tepidiformaceae bacterium]
MEGLFGRRRGRRDSLTSYLIQWLFLAAGVWVAAKLVDGVLLHGWKSVLIVAGILGLLNLSLKPLLQSFSLPLTIVTLGLFLLVINTVLVAATARVA